MYDSSLDQFAYEQWYEPKFNDYNAQGFVSKMKMGFDHEHTYFGDDQYLLPRMELKFESTRLIWFGFDFNNTNSDYKRKEYRAQLTRKSKKPAHSKMVSGIVSDRDGTLPGANIGVKGTIRTATSDMDGFYEIEAATGEILEFDFIGMESTARTVKNEDTINVTMINRALGLEAVVVEGYRNTTRASTVMAQTTVSSKTMEDRPNASFIQTLQGQVAGLSVVGLGGASPSVVIRGSGTLSGRHEALVIIDGVVGKLSDLKDYTNAQIATATFLGVAEATALYGNRGSNGVFVISTRKAIEELSLVKSRTNLSETAFFFPQLKTDANGAVKVNFTSPESLTLWKLRLLAHNKNMETAYMEKNVITQKEIMVTPNMPRFLRTRDTVTISTKISNMTSEPKLGMATIQLFNAGNMKNIDGRSANLNATKDFTIPGFGNTSVSWKITVPDGISGLQYKVTAKSGSFSDGEESIIPVLTNDLLITESIPLWVKGNTAKEFVLDNLRNSHSPTLRNHQLTLEYTSNPTWLALQSLPYLMEYEHDCSEQTFARLYAYTLAEAIIKNNPKVIEVFQSWLKSEENGPKLAQNEQFKSIVLAETPWLADSESEEDKRQHLATLFDLPKMEVRQQEIFKKLQDKQRPSGAFAWFEGGNENEQVTAHILAGLGHLKKLASNAIDDDAMTAIAKTAIPYLDKQFLERRVKTMQSGMVQQLTRHMQADLYYCYMRSFYSKSFPASDAVERAMKGCVAAVKNDWVDYPLYEKGLAALVLYRVGETFTAKKIIESLKETAATNEDWGMYWIENKPGFYWNTAPIETQSLLIEAFLEVNGDRKSADDMKVWLVKNKQNKNWPTTKSTTEAVHALMLQGTDWAGLKDNTNIKIGIEKFAAPTVTRSEKEAESGYFKINWSPSEIKKEMATVTIENKSKIPGFGGLYWQYFEDVDHVIAGEQGILSVSKKLYLKKAAENGFKLFEINAASKLHIGDLVTVRMIVTAKEDMEYVHLKDLRAACFEPVEVLSQYEWADGLGYYRSTKDVATHYFLDQIAKGTFILEYDVRVNNSGNFSNGITTIESMYAPEFTSHTNGTRVDVAD